MPVRRERAFHEAAYIARGPVVYCYAPAYDAIEANGETTLCAREGFAVALKKDAPIEAAEDGKTLRTRGVSASNWGMKGESCDQPPITLPEGGEEIDVTLVPYAGAAIRLSVMPQV